MSKDLIIRAAQFASYAHAGVFRKWSDEPYSFHTSRVAGRASMLSFMTPEGVAGSHLHDIIEDCDAKIVAELYREFENGPVLSIVEWLTNPSKRRPDLNRRQRKLLDWQQLRTAPLIVKAIKYIDRDDNLAGMVGADDGFRKLYAEESRELAKALWDGMLETDETIALHNRLITSIERLEAYAP